MKKIISAILAISVILTSVSSFAVVLDSGRVMESILKFDTGDFVQGDGASEGEINDPDVKRMEFLEAVGIWDDASIPKDSLVTITEFLVIMSRLRLGAENAFKGVYNMPENSNDTNATYNDAYTFLIDALGYKYKCAEYEDSDRATLVVAADIGLVLDNPENINAYITRNELAKLIARAVTIDVCMMEYTAQGGKKYAVVPGRTLLSAVHNVYDVSGFVNAIPGLAVYGGTRVRDGYIQIERRNMNTSGLALEKYFGSYVNAYAKYNEDTNEHSIIYIDYADENVKIEIDFSQIGDIKNGTLTYEIDGREEEITVDGLKYITENGSPLGSIDEMCDFKDNEGKIVFSSANKDGDIDTAIIYKYFYSTIEYNDLIDNRIGLKFVHEYDGKNYIQIDEKDTIKAYINGVEADYTTLKANSAFKFFRTADGYIEIHASTETASGEVVMAYDDIVSVGGKEYRIAGDFLKYIELCNTPGSGITGLNKVSPITLGTTGTFYVIDGVITGYTTRQDYTFGYLKSVLLSRTSIDPKLSLRIFTAGGEWIEAEVDEKIELDGIADTTDKQLLAAIEENRDIIVDDIVRYRLNGERKIIGLDTRLESTVEEEYSRDVKFIQTFNGSLDHTLWFLGANNQYFLGSDMVIFVIPDYRNSESNYKIISPSTLTSNTNIKIDLYSPDDFLQCKAGIMYGNGSSASTAGSYTVYIQNIRTVIDAETGEISYRIMGKEFLNQRARAKGTVQDTSFYMTEELFNTTHVEVGDVVNVELGARNFANSVIISYPGGVVPDTYKYEQSVYDSTRMLVVGRIERIDVANDLVVINTGSRNVLTVPRAKGIIDTNSKKVYAATLSDFHPGDEVCAMVCYGHGDYIFKNTQ